MTTDELVAIFVGVVTAITTVASGIVRSSRAGRLRKELQDDLVIFNRLPSGNARPLLRQAIERKSADLVALTLVPMRVPVIAFAFVTVIAWGAVVIVFVLEGPGPLLFQAGFGRGTVNWLYLLIGIAALSAFVRGVRALGRDRARVRRIASEAPP